MRERGQRRPKGPVIVSVVLHLVLAAALAQMTLSPWDFSGVFDREPARSVERVRYLATPQAGPADTGRSGGDDRPLSRTPRPGRPPAALVAPTTIPTSVPAAPVAADAGGSGERIGAGGPTQGVRPSYGDARLWAPADVPPVIDRRAPAERLDSALRSSVQRHVDSMALAGAYRVPGKLERGDWTVDGPGGKWGIDDSKIRLGKVSLPSAVLALLPLNMQGGNSASGGNPTARDRARVLAQMRADIDFQSQRMLNEEELRVAAKRIRERKDRERRERGGQGEPVTP